MITKEVTLSCSDAWTIEIPSDVTWVKVNPMSGTAGNTHIDVSVDTNESTSERSCTITAWNSDKSSSATLSIKQHKSGE